MAREWRTSSITAQLTASSLAPKTRKPVYYMCVTNTKNLHNADNLCSSFPFTFASGNKSLAWPGIYIQNHVIIPIYRLTVLTQWLSVSYKIYAYESAHNSEVHQQHKFANTWKCAERGRVCKHVKNATDLVEIQAPHTAYMMVRAERKNG